jgi:hypothetical protein
MRGIHLWMLHFVQHDRLMSFRTLSFVIPSVSEESSTWMLHFVQHDRPMSFRTLSFVIPSVSEESSTWMLRFAQHDRSGKCGCFASFSMTDRCHSEHSLLSFRTPVRNPLMDASLRCASFSMTCCVIPNTLFCHSERQRGIQHMDASLRCAPFSMTCCVIPNAFSLSFQMFFPCYSEYFFLSFQAPARNPARCGCFALLSMAGSGMATSCPSPCKRRGTSAHGRQGEVKLTFVPTPRIRLSCR